MIWPTFKKEVNKQMFTRQQVVEQITEYKEATILKYQTEQDPMIKADLFGLLKGYESTLGLLKAEYK